jgi:hypothetical protein
MGVNKYFNLQRKRSSRRGKDEKILVEVFPKENRISIQVRKQTNTNWLSGKAKDEASSMVVIVHTLDALVEDWYQTKKMVLFSFPFLFFFLFSLYFCPFPQSKVMVPCIHCLRDTVKEAHLFSIETCQRAVIHNRTFLRCPASTLRRHRFLFISLYFLINYFYFYAIDSLAAEGSPRGTPVRIALLAPDLAMSHLHSARVKYEDMQFGRPLGEGAYSLVYQGTFKDGSEVAIKKLKNPLRSFEEFRREIWMMRCHTYLGRTTRPVPHVFIFFPVVFTQWSAPPESALAAWLHTQSVLRSLGVHERGTSQQVYYVFYYYCYYHSA